MTIKELLEKDREYYLNHFKKSIASIENGTPEVLLEMKNEEKEELFRLYRFDCIVTTNDKPQMAEFNLDGYLNHDLVTYTVNDAKIEFSPMMWNACEISIDNKLSDKAAFYAWIKKWIDIFDLNTTDENGFQRVIHNVTRPKEENGWTTFSIDLGSSPIEALIELLELFINASNIKTIKVGSPTMIN